MSRISFRYVRMATAIIAILTVVIVVISVFSFRTVVNQSLKNQCDTVMSVLSTDVAGKQQETTTIAKNFSENGQIIRGVAAHDSSTIATVFQSESDSGVFAAFCDAQGTLIWKSDNFTGTPDFSVAMQKKSVTDLYADGSKAMYYRSDCPIFDQNNVLLGAVVVGYDLSNNEIVDDIKAKTKNEATVFLGDVRLSTTVKKADGSRAVGTKLKASVAAQVIQQGKVYTGETTILDQNMIAKYQPLKDSSGKVVGAIFTGQPTADIDKGFAGIATKLIVVALLVGILALLILAKFTHDVVITPIVSIKNLMLQVKEGNLDAEMARFKHRSDELGELADSVETTIAKLHLYIQDISRVLGSMAKCDFAQTSEVEYDGSFAAIHHAMTEIRRNIKEVIGGLQIMSSELQAEVSDISAGAEKLAQGSTEQAATIQNLMDSIESISSRVAHNAEKASSARRLAEQTAQKMENGEATVQHMQSAMLDIEQKSHEISQIIKAIENIAFQTNILALNAAVEAARAGESGKGFSVVAQEVRGLAEHSSAAANNTTALIGATIHAVKGGVEYAEDVATSIGQVREDSEQTNTLMEEIDQVTSEQANSLAEISENMSQISIVVQQNSATAEESSAACYELDRQFVELKAMIERFKI